MAYSFSYRGVRAEDLEIDVLNVNRSILPPNDAVTLDIPGRAGSFFLRTEYQARAFTVDIYINKQNTMIEAQDRTVEIANFLDATPGLGDLIFDDEPDRVYQAILTDDTDLEQVTKSRFSAIRFIAPFPFSESLSEKEFTLSGFQAPFVRPTIAYDLDGNLVNTNIERYDTGLYGDAIIIEEGTQNGFPADISNFETIASLGQVTGYNATLSRDIRHQYSGNWSLKTSTNGTVIGEGVGTIGITGLPISTTLTFSLFLIASRAANLEIVIEQYDGGSVLIGTTTSPLFAVPDETGELERIFITFSTLATLSYAIFKVITSGSIQYVSFWTDGWQIEQKAYATSWVIGGTTRDKEVLTFPIRDYLLNNDVIKEGTIEFSFARINPNSDSFSALFDWGTFSGGNTIDRLVILHGTSIGTSLRTFRFQMVHKEDTTTDLIEVALPFDSVQGDFYYVCVRWDLPGTMKIDIYDYINKTWYTNSKVSVLLPPRMDLFQICSLGESDQAFYVNAKFDEFRATNRIRTDAEILESPTLNRPLPVDEVDVLKFTFDDNFDLYNTNVSNEGTAAVNYEITIVFVVSGAYVQLELVNTGQIIRLEDTFIADDVIIIDSIDKVIYKNGVVDMSILTLDSEFYQLPKDDNAFKITTTNFVFAKITYTPTWL